MYGNQHYKKSKIDIVAIAASAGGVTAIRKVLSRLPANFPVPILCLQHLSLSGTSVLVQVLQLRTHLKVRWANQDERLTAGVVYVCPPGHYFVVHANGTISLAPQATKQGWLQGVNRFFESVATNYAERAAVVVLTGSGNGGAEGVRAVHQQHGTVLVQDIASTIANGMPKAAIATKCVDQVLPPEKIADFLMSLISERKPGLAAQVSNVTALLTSPLLISPMLQDKLEYILEQAIAMHRTNMGNIHLFDQQTSLLLISTQRGFNSDYLDYFRTVSINDHSVYARAIRAGESVMIENVEADPLYRPYRVIAAAAGYRAVQSTPLMSSGGKLVGALSTHFRQPRQFLPWEMNLINMHARHAADLIELLTVNS